MRAASRVAGGALAGTGRPIVEHICLQCRLALRPQRRHASAAATATAPSPTQTLSTSSSTTRPSLTVQRQQTYSIQAAVVLSRPPLLTRTPTPFETQFYLYNRRLNERLALPFTRYFYYRKGTPSDGEWKRKVRYRNGTAARDLGRYVGYGRLAWNDEVLVGDPTGEFDSVVEEVRRDAEDFVDRTAGRGEVEQLEQAATTAPAKTQGGSKNGGEETLEQQAEVQEKQEREDAAMDPKELDTPADEEQVGLLHTETFPRPLPRITEADRTNDTRSLNRKLDRTLYLVVKDKDGKWVFPSDVVKGREGLSQTAERILISTGGTDMNTWVLGHAPIGYDAMEYTTGPITDTTRGTSELGRKLFFMKARIMTGQANLEGNKYGATDMAWLAREELQDRLGKGYWSAVRGMIPER